MKRVIVALALALALMATPAQGHARHVHRVWEFRCGGWTWISPRPVHVPPDWRNNPHLRWWCEAHIPPFTRW